ncbi:MAG: formylglycine-generating enzyme family protein [Opitutales bacterium]|nr:formylglycine-generating enzyme family protein [Opitutales bacterium]NRA27024.1 formylglycine-generating enzyme family protein [Opitutales bacterium]
MEPENSKQQPPLRLPIDDHQCLVFHHIPAKDQRFRMGARGEHANEEPRHWVGFRHDYWLGETPVTQAHYAALAKMSRVELDSAPSDFKNKPDHPVESVSWDDCQQLLTGLRANWNLPEGLHLRLPTEAEWEYACRAGTDTDYYAGDGAAALSDAGWYDENSGISTHPVRSATKRPNAFGLWDMHGNVWEWCQDDWGVDLFEIGAYRNRGFQKDNAIADETGQANARRVPRGGSWFNSAGDCRSAFRFRDHPGFRSRIRGFRFCLSSGPVENQPASGDAGASGANWAVLNPPERL